MNNKLHRNNTVTVEKPRLTEKMSQFAKMVSVGWGGDGCWALTHDFFICKSPAPVLNRSQRVCDARFVCFFSGGVCCLCFLQQFVYTLHRLSWFWLFVEKPVSGDNYSKQNAAPTTHNYATDANYCVSY